LFLPYPTKHTKKTFANQGGKISQRVSTSSKSDVAFATARFLWPCVQKTTLNKAKSNIDFSDKSSIVPLLHKEATMQQSKEGSARETRKCFERWHVEGFTSQAGFDLSHLLEELERIEKGLPSRDQRVRDFVIEMLEHFDAKSAA
jgi:hypothetical protein